MKQSNITIQDPPSQVEPISPAISVPTAPPAYPDHFDPLFLALYFAVSSVPHFCVEGDEL